MHFFNTANTNYYSYSNSMYYTVYDLIVVYALKCKGICLMTSMIPVDSSSTAALIHVAPIVFRLCFYAMFRARHPEALLHARVVREANDQYIPCCLSMARHIHNIFVRKVYTAGGIPHSIEKMPPSICTA